MAQTHSRLVTIGTYQPRLCGIATFTTDLTDAVAKMPGTDVFTVAVNDQGVYDYPERVRFEIAQEDVESYHLAADFINREKPDGVILQHEYGIFGGPSGSHILELLGRLEVPVTTNFHTILEHPSEEQHRILVAIAARSERVVTMSEHGVTFLQTVYSVPSSKIDLIPHGVPVVPFEGPSEQAISKASLGLEGRNVILTFGLLSQNKGIETAIRALPEIVAAHPDVIYLVLGATHPHILAHEGERYREFLQDLAERLGVAANVRFENRFVSLEELVQFLSLADLYVTPYLNREQITSGTLAYALGLGKAIVSTPYWYAEELLADGRGELVPFGDTGALAQSVSELLGNPERYGRLRRRAYAYSRAMTWPRVAERYVAGVHAKKPRRIHEAEEIEAPPLNLGHLRALSDDTGVFQHATFTLPNRHEGYTTDDNARALMVSVMAERLGLGVAAELRPLTRTYLAFLWYAFDHAPGGGGRFCNFMGFDRGWLEAIGSENSHARALRALAALQDYEDEGLREAAFELFRRALPAAHEFRSPRAAALTLLAFREGFTPSEEDAARSLGETLTRHLLDLFEEVATPDWPWFETYLSYSNAKVPHALLRFGHLSGQAQAVEVGLESLGWLVQEQTAPQGYFAPVGCLDVYRRGERKPRFDQQPVEAYATVSACLEAYSITAETHWLDEAKRTFAWFLGRNDLGLPVYDATSGGCFDGLHAHRINRNQGSESTLCYLLAHLELAEVEQAHGPLEMTASHD